MLARSYPVPADEPARLSELHRYKILDSEPEEVFDDFVRLGRNMFDVAACVISFIDEGRQWFKARYGIEAKGFGRGIGFCHYTILSRDVMVVPDTRADPRFKESLLVTGAPFMRFYAGAPLVTPSGFCIGTLCLMDTQARPAFRSADSKQLEKVADLVMIEVRKRAALAESRTDERYASGVKGVLSGFRLKPQEISVMNVSTRGAMIRCFQEPVPKGEEIILMIGKVMIVATVAWAKANMQGLAFHRDLTVDELKTFRATGLRGQNLFIT